MAQPASSSPLRRLYQNWVEEQIEEFKESVPRSELLRIADEVVSSLEMNRRGQYQLTEILLLEEVDRMIFRRLKLPTFRIWSAGYARKPASELPKRVTEQPDQRPVLVARAAS